MTKGELKQILGVLDAQGCPDSAIVQHAGVELQLSPVNMQAPVAIVETLDSEGNWTFTNGPMSAVTAISFS